MEGVLNFEIEGSGGVVRQYTLVPIQRKAAMWVMDTFLKTAASSVVQGLDSIISVVAGSGSLRGTSITKLARSLDSVTGSLDFEKHWQAASMLFTGAVIRSTTSAPILGESCTVTIDDFEVQGADYFRDNPLEYYVATFLAIDRNWPGFFIELRARVNDLRARFMPGKKTKSAEPNA